MRFGTLIWAALGAIIALLFFLPLSWVGPHFFSDSLTTDKTMYKGTVWTGSIENLRDVESVDYVFRPFKVLTSKSPVNARLSAAGLLITGSMARSKAEDVILQIDVSSLPIPDPRLRGLAGRVDVQITDATWTETGTCKAVKGMVKTDVLTQNRGLFNWTGPQLNGPVICDDKGRYVFNLTGQDDTQNISARVAISVDGSYQTNMQVVTRDADAALALPLFGFDDTGRSQDGMEFRLVEQGRWR